MGVLNTEQNKYEGQSLKWIWCLRLSISSNAWFSWHMALALLWSSQQLLILHVVDD